VVVHLDVADIVEAGDELAEITGREALTKT